MLSHRYFRKVTMITFDLKSGYHHVDINQDCWPYLGFSWYGPWQHRQFFMFQVLPFGLSTACYVFTKLLRPLIKFWRSKGRLLLCLSMTAFVLERKQRSIAQPSKRILERRVLYSI